MVAELVNKTGVTYTAKDPNYAVVDQLRKDIMILREGTEAAADLKSVNVC